MATSAPPKPGTGKSTEGIPQSNFDREFAGITNPENLSQSAEDPFAKTGDKETAKGTGGIPTQDLRATPEEQRYASAADRGFASGPKAAFNELRNNRAAKKIPTTDARESTGKQALQRGIKDAGTVGKEVGKAATQGPQSLANPSKLRKFTSGVGKAREAGKNYRKSLKEQAQDQAKKQAKRAAKQVARNAARSLAAETFGLSVVVVEAFIHWRITLYIGIGLLLLIVLIADDAQSTGSALKAVQQQQQQGQQGQTTNPLQVTINCTPADIPVGKTSVCTINVTYPGSASDINVVATIYPKAEYVTGSANNKGVYDATNQTVSWDAKQEKLSLATPINLTFKLTVKKTIDTQGVPITASASVSGGTIGGGNVAANKNNCGGNYTLNNPIGNFGDPQCNFTKQAFGAELNQLDPSHKYTWDCIARYESTGGTGYDPNAYNGNSTSGFGAYGLFQMNPPGKGNGQYDNGAVNWTVQISNAINYNKTVLGGNFSYWGTYQSHGGPCH